MTTGRPGRLAMLLVGGVVSLALTGCGGVNRRFVVESNVPGAQVYINDRPIGPAPANSSFEYYGYYKVAVIHPDYQTVTKRVHIIAPWYAYPPFDFLVDVVWPFGINDTRPLYFELGPARQTNTAELITTADALRQRGWNLPPPPPQPPYAKKQPPLLGPPITVPTTPAEPNGTPTPEVPPVTAPPSAAPPPPSSLIPSVSPAGFTPPSSATFLR